jgi:hypothetical protein
MISYVTGCSRHASDFAETKEERGERTHFDATLMLLQQSSKWRSIKK